MTITYKCATEKEFGQFIWGLVGTQKVAEAPSINPNSWAWSSTYKAAHINDASTTEKAAVQLPVGRLQSGDKITLTVEVMNLTENKTKITLDQTLGLTTEGIVKNALVYQTTKTNEFETVKLTYIVEDDGYYACVVGSFRADISEFYVRDVIVNVESVVNQPSETFINLKKELKTAVIYTSATGVFVRENIYGDDLATLTVDNDNKKITIWWSKPFVSTKRPIAFTSGDGYASSPKYFYRAQSPTSEKVDIYIFDVATNTLQSPSTIATASYFSLLVVGLVDY